MIKIRSDLLEIRQSETLAINELSKKIENEGNPVYKFGFGQSPFPVPADVVEALRNNAHQKEYEAVQGLPELRNAIARHFNYLIDGVNYNLGSVFIGPGSKELIYLLQLIFDIPLIILNPSWVSYAPQAAILKKKTFQIPLNESNWKIAPLVLKNYIDSANIKEGILLLNYPSNPTGQHLSNEELEHLAIVCRSHNLIVISDEIYGELTYDFNYRSIATYYPEGTIITSGLSKWCGAGGWRLGYAIFPEKFETAVNILKAIASETFSAVSAPIQYAGIAAFTPSSEIEKYRKATVQILDRIAGYCYSVLNEHDIAVQKSKGGFYLFPVFNSFRIQLGNRSIYDSGEMCCRLLKETGVALLPGTVFGRPANELSARLAFVDFDGDEALSCWDLANKESTTPIEKICPKIVAGLNVMIAWLQS